MTGSDDMSSTERSLNLPNVITFSRFVLSFVLFALMDTRDHWLLVALLFVLAVLTDVLDGWIARRFNLVTQLGRIMDPFVDKFITCGTFLFLLPVSQDSGVTAWMVVLVLGREILVTSIRGFLEQRGADFSASTSGKLKMFLQCLAAVAAILSMDPSIASISSGGVTFSGVRDFLLWLMVLATLWSGYDYVKRAIELLRRTESQT